MSEINFDEQYERALKAGEEANRTEARAASASYDPERKLIVVQLKNGGPFSFPTAWVSGLRDASDEDLAAVEITPSGEGLHWDELDEDLSLPALINGFFGPHDQGSTADLAPLYAVLEEGWFVERDPSIIDRVAAENPMYSSELYEYFAQLIDSELQSEADEAGKAAARTARKWLETEGFEAARRISTEANQTSSNATPTPPPQTPVPGISTADPQRTGGEVLTFPELIQERTGMESEEAEQRLELPGELIFLLQQQAAGKQPRIRDEISNRSEQRLGLDRYEARQSLDVQWLQAARHRSDAAVPSFRELLSELEMSEEERAYWLDLADEEN